MKSAGYNSVPLRSSEAKFDAKPFCLSYAMSSSTPNKETHRTAHISNRRQLARIDHKLLIWTATAKLYESANVMALTEMGGRETEPARGCKGVVASAILVPVTKIGYRARTAPLELADTSRVIVGPMQALEPLWIRRSGI